MTKNLRDLEQAATPGPWEAEDTTDVFGVDEPTGWFRSGPQMVDVGDYSTLTYADAAFIAAWRNAAPFYLALEDAARAHDRTHRGSDAALDRTEAPLRNALAALDGHLAGKP